MKVTHAINLNHWTSSYNKVSIKDHGDYLELDAESECRNNEKLLLIVGLDEHLEEFLGPELIGHQVGKEGREGVGISCLVVFIILLYCDI